MSKILIQLDRKADNAKLKEWCLTCCDFIVKTYPEMSEFVNEMRHTITRIDDRQSVRQMRNMYKEVNWLLQDKYLPDSAMDSLNQILTEKFKYNLIDVASSEKAEIQKILKHGKIRNDSEYELEKRQEEKIYDDESQFDYAESLRNLLSDYEINS